MNAYVRGELKFEDDLPYEIFAGVQPWNYGAQQLSQRQRTPGLRHEPESLPAHPRLRRPLRSGLPDRHHPAQSGPLPLDPAYRPNITYSEFDAGHMMYVNQPDLKKMQATLENFLK